MIAGIGIDMVDLARIERAYKKFGGRFLNRILTANETRNMPRNCIPYIAGRFAAKEAAVKALGSGFALGVKPADIEILNNNLGMPVLRFYGKALEIANNLNYTAVHVSITHERGMAAATVIMEG